MTPQRARDVERICQAALEQEPSARAAFLVEACAGDDGLRREVESLLAHESGAIDFLSTPAVAVADRLSRSSTSLIGGRLGSYQVLALIDAGGMGEVYRAHDTKLGRDVAIKVLPRAFASDPNRLARFQHEARMLAALNHPHIGTIYGLEEVDGIPALVLELVEGQTLADRLADASRRTLQGAGLPLAEALTIARQVAEALEAAHEKGIVHRDIKPANVMVTKDGTVKILDFGIAKLSGVTSLTQTGVSVGTVAYMAPEQLQGGSVDRRADVWALGVVLYEMVTGVRPFHGDHHSAAIYAILNHTPKNVSDLRPDAPAGVGSIIARALQKDAARRYATAADFRDDLNRCQAALPISTSGVSIADLWHGFRRSRAAVAAVCVALTIVVGAAVTWSRGAEARRVRSRTLPEIQRLIEQDRWQDAFDLAQRAEQVVPQEATLAELWPRMSVRASFETTPPNAEVLARPYAADDREWTRFGRAPLNRVRLPWGPSRIQVRAEGYETFETLELFSGRDPVTMRYALQKSGTVPAGMVWVAGGPLAVAFPVLGRYVRASQLPRLLHRPHRSVE